MLTGGESRFTLPPLHSSARCERVAVTAFRDYLASPYRYYLKHILRLRPVEEHRSELDGAQFGTLLHDTLASFHDSEVANSSDQGEILEYLVQTAGRLALLRYGPVLLPALQIQLRRAERRLKKFAEWQARRPGEGWRIFRASSLEALLPGLHPEIRVYGQVDRVDLHAGGHAVVYDYKTGEAAASPEQVHRSGTEWVDLQLPLYRHLVMESCGIRERVVRMGYLCLSPGWDPIERMATWDPSELASADAAAAGVLDGIAAGRFDRIGGPTEFPDGFDGLCFDRCVERPAIARRTWAGALP